MARTERRKFTCGRFCFRHPSEAASSKVCTSHSCVTRRNKLSISGFMATTSLLEVAVYLSVRAAYRQATTSLPQETVANSSSRRGDTDLTSVLVCLVMENLFGCSPKNWRSRQIWQQNCANQTPGSILIGVRIRRGICRTLTLDDRRLKRLAFWSFLENLRISRLPRLSLRVRVPATSKECDPNKF